MRIIIAEADDAPGLLPAVDQALTVGEQPDIVTTDVRLDLLQALPAEGRI